MSKKLLDYFDADIQSAIIKEVLKTLPADELKKALEEKGTGATGKEEDYIKTWADQNKNS